MRRLIAEGADLEAEARFVDMLVGRRSSVLDIGCGHGSAVSGLRAPGALCLWHRSHSRGVECGPRYLRPQVVSRTGCRIPFRTGARRPRNTSLLRRHYDDRQCSCFPVAGESRSCFRLRFSASEPRWILYRGYLEQAEEVRWTRTSRRTVPVSRSPIAFLIGTSVVSHGRTPHGPSVCIWRRASASGLILRREYSSCGSDTGAVSSEPGNPG